MFCPGDGRKRGFPPGKALPARGSRSLTYGGRLKGLQVWHGRHNRKEGTMKRKIKGFLISAVFYCMLLAGPVLAAQGTDGTEPRVLDAQTLTIRLGPAWAGAQFALKTDVGPYPGTVAVGDDGVLRMEIGGSKAYELVCLEEAAPVREPGETETDADMAQAETEGRADEDESSPAIPVLHTALFAGSILAALGIFIFAHVVKSRREAGYDDDDDDGEI